MSDRCFMSFSVVEPEGPVQGLCGVHVLRREGVSIAALEFTSASAARDVLNAGLTRMDDNEEGTDV